MTLSEQLCLFPECRDQGSAPLHRTQVAAGELSQIRQGAGTVVRHSVVLQVTQDVFDWIQLRGVGRQILQGDIPLQTINVSLYQTRSMRLQSIPDNQQLRADRAVQGFEELNN